MHGHPTDSASVVFCENGVVSDTCYKQRAVIEFLVAEKERVGNIHKRLCAVYGSCSVDRNTVGCWVQRVKSSEI
jgi:hypothetical protein